MSVQYTLHYRTKKYPEPSYHFLTSCIPLGKLLSLAVPQFPYLNTKPILVPLQVGEIIK